VTEDHDNRISDLYLQSSQETPPAHLDRAVMDRARKSVRRRVFSPFGNQWVAGGAMLGVVILSVLLILDVPQQPDGYAPGQDAVAPSREALSETRKEAAQSDALPSDQPAGAEKKHAVPAAPGARFEFYEVLPDREVIVPEEQPRARMQQQPSTAADNLASPASTVPAGPWYLQAGSFREKERAAALRARLAGLGFKCEIQEVRVNMDIFYRVRVGPFADPEVFAASKQKLGELGIETQKVLKK
jgi:cell division protein FtsN